MKKIRYYYVLIEAPILPNSACAGAYFEPHKERDCNGWTIRLDKLLRESGYRGYRVAVLTVTDNSGKTSIMKGTIAWSQCMEPVHGADILTL